MQEENRKIILSYISEKKTEMGNVEERIIQRFSPGGPTSDIIISRKRIKAIKGKF